MDVVCSPTTAIGVDRNNLKQYTDAEIRQIYFCNSYLIMGGSTVDSSVGLRTLRSGEAQY